MLLQATLKGIGTAIGKPTTIVPELEQGTLVPLFDRDSTLRTRRCLMTTAAARRKPEVQAFREWMLGRIHHPADKATLAGRPS